MSSSTYVRVYPSWPLLCVCDGFALHCYVPYDVCVCICRCTAHANVSTVTFSLMDKQIFACFTLFVSPCLLPPTPYFAPVVVYFFFFTLS